MKVYSCLGASLLSAIAISASSSLAQLPLPIKPYQPPPTNRAPLVDIVTPSDGTMLLAPVNVHVCAVASYFTDTVASVEFFAGTNVLGVVTNSPGLLSWGDVCRLPVAYFCLTWTNVPPGAYALTATAKDLAGKSVTSAVVDISVVTNLPPHVVITKPYDGALILGPTNVNICATAFDPDNGRVTQVQFYEGTKSLGALVELDLSHPPVIRVKGRSANVNIGRAKDQRAVVGLRDDNVRRQIGHHRDVHYCRGHRFASEVFGSRREGVGAGRHVGPGQAKVSNGLAANVAPAQRARAVQIGSHRFASEVFGSRREGVGAGRHVGPGQAKVSNGLAANVAPAQRARAV